ncbi:DUF4097 family beta strand repeat protein [candidate division WOR-3 bacterium]|nr:DUF4097 family beta strand repeat protein [candidate division WOR-3 bacterium]
MTFSKPEGNLGIEINLRNSDLSISFEERDDIEVEFDELRKNAAEDRFEVTLENGKLKLKEKKEKSWMRSFHREPSDVEFVTVKIPSLTETEGSVISFGGDVETKDMNFKGKFLVYSGDLSLKGKTKADADFKVYSGDLKCDSYSGSMRTQIYSGDIEIVDAAINFVELKSYSGDVVIKGSFSLSKNSEIKTLSGDTSLTVNEYSGEAELFIKSLNGEIEIEGEYPKEKIHVSKLSDKFAEMSAFHLPKFRKIFSKFDNFPDRKEVKIDENAANIEKILDMVSQGKLDADSAEKLIKAIR